MRKAFYGLIAVLTFLSLASGIATPAYADGNVNNFVIPNYHIDYSLSTDAAGHSTLKTVETIAAQFPTYDQNHGIERALPISYDGHSTRLNIQSVTDSSEVSLPYTTHTSNNNLVLRIGKADTYVHGLQQYVITYTQQDVTKYFANTASDEFYWDTNGTEWAVPINALSVALHIDGSLNSKRNNNQQCYQGVTGATEKCSLTTLSDGFALQASNLRPHENVTIAVGFVPQAFRSYTPSLTDKLAGLWFLSLAITIPVGLGLMLWFIIRYNRQSNRASEHVSIIPEYTPPKDTSVAAAARIYRNARGIFSAQLIDFAVRGYLRIYQTREQTLFRKAQYELEISKDLTDLKSEEQELLGDIFPSVTVGSRLKLSELKKNSSSVATKLSDNPKKLDKDIKGSYGLRAQVPSQTKWFKTAAVYCLILAVVTLSPSLLLAAITAFICGFILYPLTDKGLALFHYLEGLKMYIHTAETERIRMLQSPETAEKLGAPIDTGDARQLVKLYERVLPYAILFGQEKQWNKQLGQYYENIGESPAWMQSNNQVFNAAVFTSTLSSFNSAVTYSSPSSSTSGGSSGGGSSGGGGGGGGGGGW